VRLIGVRTALLALSLAGSVAAADPMEASRVVWITDGDTFRLESGERIRITEIGAAETQPDNAKCRAELRAVRRQRSG
jgi:hypothetical protein